MELPIGGLVVVFKEYLDGDAGVAEDAVLGLREFQRARYPSNGQGKGSERRG